MAGRQHCFTAAAFGACSVASPPLCSWTAFSGHSPAVPLLQAETGGGSPPRPGRAPPAEEELEPVRVSRSLEEEAMLQDALTNPKAIVTAGQLARVPNLGLDGVRYILRRCSVRFLKPNGCLADEGIVPEEFGLSAPYPLNFDPLDLNLKRRVEIYVLGLLSLKLLGWDFGNKKLPESKDLPTARQLNVFLIQETRRQYRLDSLELFVQLIRKMMGHSEAHRPCTSVALGYVFLKDNVDCSSTDVPQQQSFNTSALLEALDRPVLFGPPPSYPAAAGSHSQAAFQTERQLPSSTPVRQLPSSGGITIPSKPPPPYPGRGCVPPAKERPRRSPTPPNAFPFASPVDTDHVARVYVTRALHKAARHGQGGKTTESPELGSRVDRPTPGGDGPRPTPGGDGPRPPWATCACKPIGDQNMRPLFRGNLQNSLILLRRGLQMLSTIRRIARSTLTPAHLALDPKNQLYLCEHYLSVPEDTHNWEAPEFWQEALGDGRKMDSLEKGIQANVYSLILTVWDMLGLPLAPVYNRSFRRGGTTRRHVAEVYGRVPRQLPSVEVLKKDLLERYNVVYHEDHLNEFLDLSRRMLAFDPNDRISVSEALQHPFIQFPEIAATLPPDESHKEWRVSCQPSWRKFGADRRQVEALTRRCAAQRLTLVEDKLGSRLQEDFELVKKVLHAGLTALVKYSQFVPARSAMRPASFALSESNAIKLVDFHGLASVHRHAYNSPEFSKCLVGGTRVFDYAKSSVFSLCLMAWDLLGFPLTPPIDYDVTGYHLSNLLHLRYCVPIGLPSLASLARACDGIKRDENGRALEASAGVSPSELLLFLDLSQRMLRLHPEDRCSAAEALQHSLLGEFSNKGTNDAVNKAGPNYAVNAAGPPYAVNAVPISAVSAVNAGPINAVTAGPSNAVNAGLNNAGPIDAGHTNAINAGPSNAVNAGLNNAGPSNAVNAGPIYTVSDSPSPPPSASPPCTASSPVKMRTAATFFPPQGDPEQDFWDSLRRPPRTPPSPMQTAATFFPPQEDSEQDNGDMLPPRVPRNMRTTSRDAPPAQGGTPPAQDSRTFSPHRPAAAPSVLPQAFAQAGRTHLSPAAAAAFAVRVPSKEQPLNLSYNAPPPKLPDQEEPLDLSQPVAAASPQQDAELPLDLSKRSSDSPELSAAVFALPSALPRPTETTGGPSGVQSQNKTKRDSSVRDSSVVLPKQRLRRSLSWPVDETSSLGPRSAAWPENMANLQQKQQKNPPAKLLTSTSPESPARFESPPAARFEPSPNGPPTLDLRPKGNPRLQSTVQALLSRTLQEGRDLPPKPANDALPPGTAERSLLSSTQTEEDNSTPPPKPKKKWSKKFSGSSTSSEWSGDEEEEDDPEYMPGDRMYVLGERQMKKPTERIRSLSVLKLRSNPAPRGRQTRSRSRSQVGKQVKKQVGKVAPFTTSALKGIAEEKMQVDEEKQRSQPAKQKAAKSSHQRAAESSQQRAAESSHQQSFEGSPKAKKPKK